jgi:hypothetical protein
MELDSATDDSDSDTDDKDKVFFPRTSGGASHLAMNVLPGSAVRTPGTALTPRLPTTATALRPAVAAKRKLASNGLPHVRITLASLRHVKEEIEVGVLRNHFKDFRPDDVRDCRLV